MAPITRPGAGRTATCKYCGTTGLRWENNRLIDYKTKVAHTCDEYRNKVQAPPVPATYRPIDTSDSAEIMRQASNGTSALSRTDIEAIAQRISAGNDSVWVESLIGKITAVESSTRDSLVRVLELVTKQAEQAEQAISAKVIEVKLPDGTQTSVGRQHKLFPELLEYCGLRLNVMLVGPAGSGKSSAAHYVAQALKLPFYLFPMGPAVTDSKLLGYMDANGKLVRTPFRNAYENGGVIILDEMDTANPAALTCLNGALANGHVAFPDGMVARHADFICIAGANTYGRGADRMYVGRTQLDEATLDRFLTMDWDYDREFELALAGADQRSWVQFVWRVRDIIENKGLRVTATPRSSIEGARMLRAGIPLQRVKQVRLFNKMPKDALDTIMQNL